MKILFIGGVPLPLVDALRTIGYQVAVNTNDWPVDIVHYYNAPVKPLPYEAKRTAVVREVLPDGIDYSIWNPATDQNIFRRYSPGTLSLKAQNKIALQKELGLLVDEKLPLVGLLSDFKLSRSDCQVIGPFSDDLLLHKLYAAADLIFVDNPYIASKYGTVALDDVGQLKDVLAEFKTDKAAWQKRQQRLMTLDFSWHAVAIKYISLYMRALKNIGITAL